MAALPESIFDTQFEENTSGPLQVCRQWRVLQLNKFYPHSTSKSLSSLAVDPSKYSDSKKAADTLFSIESFGPFIEVSCRPAALLPADASGPAKAEGYELEFFPKEFAAVEVECSFFVFRLTDLIAVFSAFPLLNS